MFPRQVRNLHHVGRMETGWKPTPRPEWQFSGKRRVRAQEGAFWREKARNHGAYPVRSWYIGSAILAHARVLRGPRNWDGSLGASCCQKNTLRLESWNKNESRAPAAMCAKWPGVSSASGVSQISNGGSADGNSGICAAAIIHSIVIHFCAHYRHGAGF